LDSLFVDENLNPEITYNGKNLQQIEVKVDMEWINLLFERPIFNICPVQHD
jgi:hypothetical protein